MILQTEYIAFHCIIHQKHIYYFKTHKFMNETPCWDCWREANKKKHKPYIDPKEYEIENLADPFIAPPAEKQTNELSK